MPLLRSWVELAKPAASDDLYQYLTLAKSLGEEWRFRQQHEEDDQAELIQHVHDEIGRSKVAKACC